MGCRVVLGVPQPWQWVVVGAGGACSGSGHPTGESPSSPHQNSQGPSPGKGERVLKSWAGRGGSAMHTEAQAVGGNPDPPTLLQGAPAAPGGQSGASSSGPLPGVGVGGAIAVSAGRELG